VVCSWDEPYPATWTATLPTMPTTIFGPEHVALAAAVRGYAADRLEPHVPEWEAAGDVPAAVVAHVTEQGFLDAGAPDSGRPHGDLRAAVAVAEALGAVNAGLAVRLLAVAEARRHLGAATGSEVCSELLAPVAGAGLRATARGTGWRLHGSTGAVPGLAGARTAVVVADTHDGPLVARVPVGDGFARRPVAGALGWGAAGLAALDGDVEVPADAVLWRGDAAAAEVGESLRRWWLLGAAVTTAAAWSAWEAAKGYALQREAFGRPIARFQVQRHGLAEAATHLTAARAMVHDVAWQGAEQGSVPDEAALARRFAARAASSATDRCLQVHGGYGYTMEYDVQRAWRDALMFGDDEPLRLCVAQTMGL
jgi:alkylation response protein AidB-like acyl-CoA dehydrogenase